MSKPLNAKTQPLDLGSPWPAFMWKLKKVLRVCCSIISLPYCSASPWQKQNTGWAVLWCMAVMRGLNAPSWNWPQLCVSGWQKTFLTAWGCWYVFSWNSLSSWFSNPYPWPPFKTKVKQGIQRQVKVYVDTNCIMNLVTTPFLNCFSYQILTPVLLCFMI